MSDSLLQRSVTTAVARNLTTTTKTNPKMMSITVCGWLPKLKLEALSVRSPQVSFYPATGQPKTAMTVSSAA